MGREIKRVSLDFSWPLNKVWEGYLNPHYTASDCLGCDGSGYSPIAKEWYDKWYGKLLFDPSETGSTPFDWLNPYVQEINRRKLEASSGLETWLQWLGAGSLKEGVHKESIRMCYIWNGQWSHHLDQEDVQALFDEGRLQDFDAPPLAFELNRAYLTEFGHDSINQYICLNARMARMKMFLDCSSRASGRRRVAGLGDRQRRVSSQPGFCNRGGFGKLVNKTGILRRGC